MEPWLNELTGNGVGSLSPREPRPDSHALNDHSRDLPQWRNAGEEGGKKIKLTARRSHRCEERFWYGSSVLEQSTKFGFGLSCEQNNLFINYILIKFCCICQFAEGIEWERRMTNNKFACFVVLLSGFPEIHLENNCRLVVLIGT